MEFTFDYGTVALTGKPKDVPLYASIDGRVAALGGDEVAFYDPLADRTHVMTAQVLQAMDLCRDFQPMDLHAQRIAEQLPGMKGQGAAVRRVLENLASRGLLITNDAWLLQFESAPARTLAPVAGIFVRACDRPAQLNRLLGSLLEHSRTFSLPAPVIVVDDSTDAAAIGEQHKLLNDFVAHSGQAGHYIGPAQWARIAAALAGESPAAAALLQRPRGHSGRRGGGIGKNLITLLAAGQRYLLLDDDFELPLQRHPEYQPGLAMGGSGWAVRTFASLDAALHAGVAIDGDPLAHHLSLCGQSLAAAMAGTEALRLTRAGLQGVTPGLLPLLNPRHRVLATVNGHRGNSGASGAAWMFLLEPDARAGLCRDADAYAALRGDPPVWWGCSRHRLEVTGNFTPFAVDNSELLPPCSPFGRGEDALFSALCRVAHGDVVQLDLPYAIGHRQEGGRDRSELLSTADTPDINHCLTELARQTALDLYASTPGKRLGVFAARLDDLAAGNDASLVSYLREYLVYRRSQLVEQLQQVAAASRDMPEPWRNDLTSVIEANGRAILKRGAPRFAGWPEDADAAACAAAFRSEADRLSSGLREWPLAWELALQQRERWLADAD